MFIEIPNFLDKKQIKFFRDTLRKFDGHPKYSGRDFQNRQGASVWISNNDDPTLQVVDKMLFEIFGKIVKDVVTPKYMPTLEVGDSGYEYHRYKPGNICVQHVDGEFGHRVGDLGNSSITTLRFASVILHLTTNTEGGDIVFPEQEKRFSTEAGKLLVFPPYSWFPHYTEPAKKDREIIVSWLLYDRYFAGKH
jgi:predicted 2-oxoglutarate/Fe(II)-dependent dioxygenase YbiX